MQALYNMLLLPVRVAAPLYAWSRSTDEAAREEWAQRLSRVVPRMPAGGVWLHGASVGEARIVAELATAVRRERPELPLAASAFTRTGFGQLPALPHVDARFYLPLDFRTNARRLFDALRPSVLGLIETELWPNHLRVAIERRVPVVLLNGRISAGRFARYRKLAGLYRPYLSRLAAIGAQSQADAERFLALGAREPAIVVTGNVKFDLPHPTSSRAAVRARLGLSDSRPVLVAGSTGRGEDELVLRAFRQVRSTFPDTFLILAPRHPERASAIARLLADERQAFVRQSEDPGDEAGRRDVLLVDTIGRLRELYAAADSAFVGGSLVPIGGHNVLEPAAMGVPVVFGPHTEHFSVPADLLLAAGGGARVADADGLAAEWAATLGDPRRRDERGRRAAAEVARHRGALEHNLRLLLDARRDGAR